MRASSPIVKGLRKLHTMGIGLMDGREFTSLDEAHSASTIIVTHSFAKRLWPNKSAVGEQVLVGCQAPKPLK